MSSTVVAINNESVEPKLTDIREYWDIAREGISFILKQDTRLTYLPEDVYSECVNGRAILFTSSIGFVVVHIEVDQFTRAKSLVIWVAYVFNQGEHSWIDNVKWFEELANDCECDFIEARSSIPQLETYFLGTGWHLSTKVFTREVQKNGR